MIDAQCPTILEPLVGYAKDLQKTDHAGPEHRKKLRAAFIEFAEESLRESRRREHRLREGVTGEIDHEEN